MKVFSEIKNNKIMAKFSPRQKLDKTTQQKLLLELCQAMVALKNPSEAAQLLADLLGAQELLMIAKRLFIAKLLIDKFTYEEIAKDLKVSPATIARVNLWLSEAGEGYRLVIKRIKNKKTDLPEKLPPQDGTDFFNWTAVKHRYPMAFWPQLLIEEIIRSANKKQRERFINTLKTLEKAKGKKELYSNIYKLFQKS